MSRATPGTPVPVPRWRGRRARRLIAGSGALVAAGAVFTMVVAQTSGGAFDLSFRSINGGGGLSAGTPYALEGSIGQPLVGKSTGTPYTVESGYFGGAGEKIKRYIVQIARDGTN